MKADLYRFTGVVGVSLIAGLIFGNILLFFTAGLSLLIIWQYKSLKQLLKWIQHGKKTEPPDVPGLINEITREIDFLRLNHKKRKKKLSRFLKRFQESTAALPDAVVILGENSVIEWANDKAEKYLGIRWPHDARQRISNLIRHPDLLKYMQETNSGFRDRGLELVPPLNPDIRLELRVIPYGEKQQLLLARDITRIYRANKMRKDFIANASHELRTPLTVISGYLETFEDDSTTDANVWKSQLQNMRNQTDRMRRLIEDLLRLSSLESDPEPASKEIIRVPELLSTIYEEAKSIGGFAEQIFSIEAEPDLWLRGNRNEIYSAFSNLIFNAVQHTPEKGVIRIRWFEDKSSACLEVIDNGEGIASEHIPRITERFYRVDKGRSREKGGTGLGLAIVKHVLARHNALLEIESVLGKGSTFRCRFTGKEICFKNKPDNLTLSA